MKAYLTFQTHLPIAVFLCRPDGPEHPDLFLLPLSTFSLKNSSRFPTSIFLFLYLTIVGSSCLLEGLNLKKGETFKMMKNWKLPRAHRYHFSLQEPWVPKMSVLSLLILDIVVLVLSIMLFLTSCCCYFFVSLFGLGWFVEGCFLCVKYPFFFTKVGGVL